MRRSMRGRGRGTRDASTGHEYLEGGRRRAEEDEDHFGSILTFAVLSV